MPASRLGYIQWYFRDWLLSRVRLRLDPDQRGAYLDILCLMYDSEDGTIEWDPSYLSRFTGIPATKIEPLKSIFSTLHGRTTHPRVQSEIARITRISERGVKNAKSRWNKKDSIEGQCSGNANPMLALAEHKQSTEQNRAEEPDSQFVLTQCSNFESPMGPDSTENPISKPAGQNGKGKTPKLVGKGDPDPEWPRVSAAWRKTFEAYDSDHRDKAAEFFRRQHGAYPWEPK